MTNRKYTTASGRAYLAAPITTFTTARYESALARMREQFPGAEVLSPRELFRGNADWLARWPNILPTLSLIVFISDEAGWVGRGVYEEIHQARRARIPVCYLTDDGTFHSFRSIAVEAADGRNWQLYARISLRPMHSTRRTGRTGTRPSTRARTPRPR